MGERIQHRAAQRLDNLLQALRDEHVCAEDQRSVGYLRLVESRINEEIDLHPLGIKAEPNGRVASIADSLERGLD